ncbi:SNF2-related protein [Candidatus Pelagibacter bacterium]|nr:SNF2-related protein [Candidatus Pelagibacter bacterium]MDA8831695.1 SNF2-related protein [Candidatus Pelagibacter bacterium]
MKAKISIIKDVYEVNFDEEPSSSIIFQTKYYNLIETEKYQYRNFSGLKNNVKIDELVTFLRDQGTILNLCKQTQEILDKIETKKEDQIHKIKHLKNLKENTTKETLNEFSESLNFLKRKLTDHQIKSSYHLFNCQSAANFSVPGSGKTSVVLAYYEKLKLEKKVDAIFLIGPKNCFYSWKTEFIETLGRDPKLNILKLFKDRVQTYKNPIKSEVYACHFITNTNDLELLKIFLSSNKFLLVIDEAHNIKKIGGKWAMAALELSKMSEFKVVLTGTPMPNEHKDFYNYFDFLYGENEIISSYDKARIDIFVEKNNLEQASEILREKFNPFFIRVSKKDLKLSPQIFNKPTIVNMNPIEQQIHDAIVTKIKSYPIKKYEQNIELIKKIRRARILRLRQNCSYVKNLLSAIKGDLKEGDENLTDGIANLISTYDDKEVPSKIESLKSIVLPIIKNNKKVLIWSSFLNTIELIKKHLQKENINIKVITGKTDLKKREEIKDQFNNKNSSLDAIIANPQACSESISLHKACNNAVYYDQNFNTAEFVQSMDRIHRVGGSVTEPVYYDFLHYENSVDEKVYKRVFAKADRQMQVIEEDNIMFDLTYSEDNIDDLYGDLNV